ncbi:MAG: hypothetical protein ACLRPT_07260 [Akkermansia muciniphila]
MDQLEIDFDFDRPIRFVDMEGGGSLITEPDLIADEYRAIVASYLEETRRICTDINADYRLVGTGDSGRRADRLPDGTSERRRRINARCLTERLIAPRNG